MNAGVGGLPFRAQHEEGAGQVEDHGVNRHVGLQLQQLLSPANHGPARPLNKLVHLQVLQVDAADLGRAALVDPRVQVRHEGRVWIRQVRERLQRLGLQNREPGIQALADSALRRCSRPL